MNLLKRELWGIARYHSNIAVLVLEEYRNGVVSSATGGAASKIIQARDLDLIEGKATYKNGRLTVAERFCSKAMDRQTLTVIKNLSCIAALLFGEVYGNEKNFLRAFQNGEGRMRLGYGPGLCSIEGEIIDQRKGFYFMRNLILLRDSGIAEEEISEDEKDLVSLYTSSFYTTGYVKLGSADKETEAMFDVKKAAELLLGPIDGPTALARINGKTPLRLVVNNVP